MSSSPDHAGEASDAKVATESAPPGMNSITNTVGMHPSATDNLPSPTSSTQRHMSCDKPGCTAEHSGKQHELE